MSLARVTAVSFFLAFSRKGIALYSLSFKMPFPEIEKLELLERGNDFLGQNPYFKLELKQDERARIDVF